MHNAMKSCIYEGRISHKRSTPTEHAFRYTAYMVYLDLDELDSNRDLRRLIPSSGWKPSLFRRADHMGDCESNLGQSVRKLIEERTGQRSVGPIRLLTQLRQFGFYFSPLNLYYCFDEDGSSVEFIVAEVNNTPWREQHCYVLWQGNQQETGSGLQYRHSKEMHVSPFMQMDVDYLWRITEPGEILKVSVANMQGDRKLFDAGMSFRRRPLTRSQLAYSQFRFPWMTARIMAGIYWQALRLWWKRCPTYQHPSKQIPSHPEVNSAKTSV